MLNTHRYLQLPCLQQLLMNDPIWYISLGIFLLLKVIISYFPTIIFQMLVLIA